ncbi:MAG: hypothetical protein AAGF30_10465, partial [Pseudomonadota bacterium]
RGNRRAQHAPKIPPPFIGMRPVGCGLNQQIRAAQRVEFLGNSAHGTDPFWLQGPVIIDQERSLLRRKAIERALERARLRSGNILH